MIRAARMTGLFYLGMAITGVLGFLVIRPRLFAAGDPGATLAHLVGNESLARAGVAVEMLMVLTQALTATWFYRLFRTVNATTASGIAAFGLVNAVIGLGSAVFLATAVEVASAPAGDAPATVHLMYLLSGNLWGVGAMFFGLWLIPMGFCVLHSGWMPRPLGWTLIGGGVGYLLGAFIVYLAPEAQVVAEILAAPAHLGEFWMVGYLLARGVRRNAPQEGRTPGSPPRKG
ncbi:DUF4386 domain-containing protein [Spongiactinospora sp. TRM90649]|uniref:DUF4386 domain-containing protein n=1 Tax=Spongiactinospora sp. TRM90649 TaxID=3031114 RepID=UPI0023F67F1A|nr:DUF4386 domain-containing protein [Spongiactinospora sp. TRM90649]MDF5752819.1 DUF4386 domain-containing protein [Spongiactinospora sp. TRM90649]